MITSRYGGFWQGWPTGSRSARTTSRPPPHSSSIGTKTDDEDAARALSIRLGGTPWALTQATNSIACRTI